MKVLDIENIHGQFATNSYLIAVMMACLTASAR